VRYRQAYRNGRIDFAGAVSKDDIRPGETRAYVFGSGEFLLPSDFRLSFGVELTSDPAYLLDYGYSEKDRLQSFVAVNRVRRNERMKAQLINFRTLRDSEIPIEDQLPYLLGELGYERRIPGIAGGEARLAFSAQGHERTSPLDILGRDVFRAGIEASWGRTFLLRPGIETLVEGRLTANSYFIGQDSTFDGQPSQVTPAVGITMRWPFARTGAQGATTLLEPVAQVVWSDTYGGLVPNEDSALVEFDEGNLVALSRFPGHDRVERGFRAALGLNWTRHDPGGWSVGATVGRVFRAEPATGFTDASGLAGLQSDWLTAVQIKTAGGLALANRTLFNDSFLVTKSETRLSWIGPRLNIGASHGWILAEPAEGRPDRINELTLDTGYAFSDRWSGSAALRYDFDVLRTQSAGIGLAYRNECLAVDLSLSRRFTSSTSVAPTTDVGLKVSLNGFGRDGRDFRRTCAG
jgi:LPS-assembly protein